MKKQFIQFLGVLTVSALLFSCKGTEGPAGPAGADGPAGPAGPAGSANVIYSAWFNINTPTAATAWRDTADLTLGGSRYGVKTASAVTQQILDQGVILSYVKWVSGGTTLIEQQSLPWSDYLSPNQFALNFTPKVGKLYYYLYTTNGGTGAFNSTAMSGIQFRYVIIPGGVAASRITSGPAAGYTIAQLRALTYNQALALLNIPAEGSNIK
jgi:hypothetical protein